MTPAFSAPLEGPRERALLVVAAPRFTYEPVPEAFDRLPPRVPTVVPVESVALAASLVVPTAPVLDPGDEVEVSLSFYYCQQGSGGTPFGDGGGFCGAMRDGTVVYPGAAACDYAYLGQTFRILGDPSDRVYRCADTGSAVHGLHRDIWFRNSEDGQAWQGEVGDSATIEVLSN